MRCLIIALVVFLSACSPPTAEQYKNAEAYCKERGMEVWQDIDTKDVKCVIRNDGMWPQFYSIPDRVLGDGSK